MDKKPKNFVRIERLKLCQEAIRSGKCEPTMAGVAAYLKFTYNQVYKAFEFVGLPTTDFYKIAWAEIDEEAGEVLIPDHEKKDESDLINFYVVVAPSGSRITTLEGLLKNSETDLELWEVERHLINKWEYGERGGIINPLFQVKAWLRRKVLKPLYAHFQPVELAINLPDKKKPQPGKVKRALVFGDSQFGFTSELYTKKLVSFHDRRVLDIVLQIIDYLISTGRPIDVVGLLGDMADLSEWSKFLETPEFLFTTQPTIIDLNLYLSRLRLALPNAEIFYFEGNHENRVELQIRKHLRAAYELRPADKLEGFPALSMGSLLNLGELGITYVEGYPHNRVFINDWLAFEHGREYKQGGAGWAKLGKRIYTVCYAHSHRRELVAKRVPVGENEYKNISAFSPGCTCKIDGSVPPGDPDSQWQQGLGIVEYTDSDHHIIPIAVNDGVALFDGQIFEARENVDEEADEIIYQALEQIQTRYMLK